MTGVDRVAYVWPKPLLVAEFRYLRKNSRYWSTWVKNECRLRSKHGRVIPRQFLATFGLRDTFFGRAFSAVTPYWLRVEVQRGCGADTPWVFSYYARDLLNLNSGYWRIAYTTFAACVAAYILFEVYDNYRLWALSRDLLRDIRKLDLVRVFGWEANFDELRRLLEVIEATDVAGLNPNWTPRGRLQSLSPGRHGPGADWFYYNPWARRVASGAELRAYFASNNRTIPDGHPRCWDHTAVPDGWAPNPFEGGDGAVSGRCNGDMPDDGNDVMFGDDDGEVPVNGANGGGGASGDSAAAAAVGVDDFDVIRRFLREVVGVPDSIVHGGGWAGFVGYMQGRFV